MSEKILQRAATAALFLVPLAPLLVYNGFLFPYTSARNFFFRALILVALSAWTLLWIQKPTEYHPRSSLLAWAMLAFALVSALASFFAPNPPLAFWSSLERMDGLVSVLFLAGFFFSVRALFNARHWKIFWNVSLYTALAVSAVALLQLFGILSIHQGGVRIDATFGNAAFFAAYMLFSLGLALFLVVEEERPCARFFYLTSAALFLFLLLASATRSSLLALPVALCVSALAAFFLGKAHKTLRRFGAVALIALAFGSGVFLIAREVPALRAHPLAGRLLSISFSGQDAEARLLAWKVAWEGFKERPLLGWGPEGYRYAFARQYDSRLYGREQWFDRAHNNYLDWLVQAGVFGLLAYLALWVGLVRAVFRTPAFAAPKKVALVGLLTGYAVFNNFAFDTLTSSLLFFALLAYADSPTSPQPPLKGGVVAHSSLEGGVPTLWSGRRMFFTFLICVVALITFYFSIAKPAYAAYLIHEGLRNNSPNLDTRLAFFTRAITLRTFATPEAREFLAQFATDVEPVLVREVSREKVASLAGEELARQMSASPMDPRYPMRLGALLNVYGMYAKAVPYLEQALALSPRKQPTLYELGTSFLNLGKMDEAVAVFKRAAELLPDAEDVESKKLYAVSLVYARRFTEAEAYIQRIFGTPIFVDTRIADAYARVGRLDKSVPLYTELEAREEAERIEHSR